MLIMGALGVENGFSYAITAGIIGAILKWSLLNQGSSPISELIKSVSREMKKQEDERKEKLAAGYIPVPFKINSAPIKSVDYHAYVEILQNTGFTNVQCINLRDMRTTFTNRYNSVDRVTIGEDRSFLNKVYPPDVKIVITYHGKK